MASIPYKLLSHGLGYVVYIPTAYLNLELAAGQTIQLLVLFDNWLSKMPCISICTYGLVHEACTCVGAMCLQQLCM